VVRHSWLVTVAQGHFPVAWASLIEFNSEFQARQNSKMEQVARLLLMLLHVASIGS